MDFITPILGAGASIASALIGSSSGDKTLAGNYIMPNGDKVGWLNGRLARGSNGNWLDMMDSINVNGLNPYLAMQNDGNIGLAQSANTPSGSADMSSGSVDASLAASRNQLFGTIGNTLQSAFANLNQQKIASAQADKLQSETEFQDIQNKYAVVDMITKLQQRMAETHDTQARQRYQDIINYITDSSKEYLIEKNHSDAVSSFNNNLLQEDEHNLNAARLRSQKLEGDLLAANLSWLPKEKAAGIAQAYAAAYASTQSGKASAAAALNYAADTYGKNFDNKMRDELRTVIKKSESARYGSQSTALDVLKEQLKLAKKNNNTYEIRLIGDMIGKLAGGRKCAE